MFGNDAPVLPNDDAIGIGMDLDRTPMAWRSPRLLLSKRTRQVSRRTPAPHGTVEAAGIGNELRPLRLEHLPDRLLGQLRMPMRLCVGDALSSSQAFSSS